jgi:hypothetical protein
LTKLSTHPFLSQFLILANSQAVKLRRFLHWSLIGVGSPAGQYPQIHKNSSWGIFTQYLILIKTSWQDGFGFLKSVPIRKTTRLKGPSIHNNLVARTTYLLLLPQPVAHNSAEQAAESQLIG